MRKNLRCYNPAKQTAPFQFFIQNKGYNSGKPHLKHLTYFFTASFNSDDECEEYYWLVYALWQSGLFRPFLYGSVVEYIRITDLAELIEIHAGLLQRKRERFMAALEQVVQIELKKTQIENNLTNLLKLRRERLREILS